MGLMGLLHLQIGHGISVMTGNWKDLTRFSCLHGLGFDSMKD